MAFSARARRQMADPLAALEGDARSASPRAILGPGAGPLPVPNGAAQDASDDDMSSVGVGEAEARQAFLDSAAAQFISATGTGVYNEVGEELHSDGTFRPVAMPPGPSSSHSPPPPPEPAAEPEYFDISSDRDAEAQSSQRDRTADTSDAEARSTSPRRDEPILADDTPPQLLSRSSSHSPASHSPVRQRSLKSPRSQRSAAGTPRARSTSPRVAVIDPPVQEIVPPALSRTVPILQTGLKRNTPPRVASPRSPGVPKAPPVDLAASLQRYEARLAENEARAAAA